MHQPTLEPFVAEVGDGFKEASESGDVAVKDSIAEKFAFSIWLTRLMVALIVGATSRWVSPRAGGRGPGDEPGRRRCRAGHGARGAATVRRHRERDPDPSWCDRVCGTTRTVVIPRSPMRRKTRSE
jgi:hypothetical protein